MNRRSFLGVLPIGAGLTLAGQRVTHIPKDGEKRPSSVHDLYPSQDPELVREIVTQAHSDVDRVKEMVELRPELAKSAWDWGLATGSRRSVRPRTWGDGTSPTY